ncbi:helix-turn-helix domain-containing protein [Photorhabdus kleinii]|uniref:helix-turn-helix domain-containing protein n=1 Tax=Photorhabdus kleinii TaxID=768034 RepID=UPI0021D4964A|nr:helix-turn-helix transcriptional regulator [Photorhabdus kleinii]MCT8342575.1 helix-turn-helix domain-containing protein [Photorhabdus kleinii]
MKKEWHTADIIAAIRKKNKTLASLSREHGLSSSTLANALTRPWPKGELLIAQEIGVTPAEIWASRYFDENEQPIKRTVRNDLPNNSDITSVISIPEKVTTTFKPLN